MSYYEIPPDQLSQMEEFAETNKEPIVMVNLLRFRDQAEYPMDSATEPYTGLEAFGRYVADSSRVREESGAKLLWRGRIEQSPIAPGENVWDVAALVQYPNADAYLTMRATPEYQAARPHRQAALLDSRLMMSVEIPID